MTKPASVLTKSEILFIVVSSLLIALFILKYIAGDVGIDLTLPTMLLISSLPNI